MKHNSSLHHSLCCVHSSVQLCRLIFSSCVISYLAIIGGLENVSSSDYVYEGKSTNNNVREVKNCLGRFRTPYLLYKTRF